MDLPMSDNQLTNSDVLQKMAKATAQVLSEIEKKDISEALPWRKTVKNTKFNPPKPKARHFFAEKINQTVRDSKTLKDLNTLAKDKPKLTLPSGKRTKIINTKLCREHDEDDPRFVGWLETYDDEGNLVSRKTIFKTDCEKARENLLDYLRQRKALREAKAGVVNAQDNQRQRKGERLSDKDLQRIG
jgi:Rad3-related DNA helicase